MHAPPSASSPAPSTRLRGVPDERDASARRPRRLAVEDGPPRRAGGLMRAVSGLCLGLALRRLAAVAGDAGRLLRQPGRLAQRARDLGDLLGRVVGREHRRLRRKVGRRRSPRARGRRPRGPRPSPGARPLKTATISLVVVRGEAVELQVLAALDVRLALGDLVGRDPRRREQLRQVGAREVLERPRVRDLVDAAAHEQVAR